MRPSGSSEYSHCLQCEKVRAPRSPYLAAPNLSAPSLAAALEHAAAGRGQFRHVGDQAGLDPFLVRNGVTTKPEGIALARLAFFVRVTLTGGRGSESDPSQHEPQRDQFLHRPAPVRAA